MTALKLATLLALALLPLGSSMAAEVSEAPEEIIVRGRLPGPPLWKVQSGENVLWIFPHLDWIPKDMIWESERVARVIAESQQVLDLPEWEWVPPRGMLLNPINLARVLRAGPARVRNPDGGSLEDNLPPELYARFAALQARYFPDNDEPLGMRPLIAGRTMMNSIRRREGLVASDDILKTIRRLVRRNRDIERTDISAKAELGDGYDDWSDRLGASWASFPPEQEQACFEQQLRQMEEGLDATRRRANNWAQGYIDEFRNDEYSKVPLLFEESKACDDLWMGSSNPEHEALASMIVSVNQMWLDAATNALATNASTFAILPINELLAEGGLLSKLKAQGYEVREP